MNEFRFSALCLIAALFAGIQSGSGQIINATVPNVSSRPAPSRAAPAPKAFGVVNPAIAPRVAPRLTSFILRNGAASYVPRAVGQSAPNLLPNYPVVARSLNPTVAAINTQRVLRMAGQEPIALDPTTRQNELRALTAMRERRGFVDRQGNLLDPAKREQRAFGTDNRTPATINAPRHVTAQDPAARPQVETRESPKDVPGKKGHNKNDRISYGDAFRRHWHERHDRNWWHDHCETIVFVSTGYYFLEGSYWYPAYGYDPLQSYYDYDGPVYTYSNLLPDEVIANVQTALQEAGYYFGAITGSLNFETRGALANFQRDYGLQITGAIDEATVESLGLGQSEVYQSADVLNSSY
jgi:Putative peptidoglycan binding domain